jgi:putative nucleotidyltransferase with HDIG domain
MMNRETALAIVEEFTQSDSLKRHMLSVEAAMRAYAPRFQGDPELWGVVGLLHDFDYERYPDVAIEGHPVIGSKILRERGVAEVIIRAILSHASEITGVMPESPLEKTLVAVDELTGFLTAVALVRPSKSILDVELKSIKKKWKDKAFAAPVNRAEIEHAADQLGVPLDEHIEIVLQAMKDHADLLGLRGNISGRVED